MRAKFEVDFWGEILGIRKVVKVDDLEELRDEQLELIAEGSVGLKRVRIDWV